MSSEPCDDNMKARLHPLFMAARVACELSWRRSLEGILFSVCEMHGLSSSRHLQTYMRVWGALLSEGTMFHCI